MLKPCNHVAGKSLLPPAALQRSDSALADVAGESCPSSGGLGVFTAFCHSLSGFYLSGSAPAETGWEGSGLSCACGDAELGAFPGVFVVLSSD